MREPDCSINRLVRHCPTTRTCDCAQQNRRAPSKDMCGEMRGHDTDEEKSVDSLRLRRVAACSQHCTNEFVKIAHGPAEVALPEHSSHKACQSQITGWARSKCRVFAGRPTVSNKQLHRSSYPWYIRVIQRILVLAAAKPSTVFVTGLDLRHCWSGLVENVARSMSFIERCRKLSDILADSWPEQTLPEKEKPWPSRLGASSDDGVTKLGGAELTTFENFSTAARFNSGGDVPRILHGDEQCRSAIHVRHNKTTVREEDLTVCRVRVLKEP